MDTITHGIVGALIGKALFAGVDIPALRTGGDVRQAVSSPTARVAIAACTLGAMFPDSDIFAGPLAHNPLAIMEWHRNLTHSILLLPIWALLLTAITLPIAARLKWKSPPFRSLFLIYTVALASHIFLDLITSFGTIAWSPARFSRPAWDWVFILDLSLTALALVPQFAAWCYRDARQFWRRAVIVWVLLAAGSFGAYWFAGANGYGFSIVAAYAISAILAAIVFLPGATGVGFAWTREGWCRAGLACVCFYIAACAAMHHKALARVEQFAAEQHLQTENLAALPLPPTLTHWVGLVSTPEGVWRATFHEPGGAIERTQLYDSAPSAEAIEQARKLHDVQVYLWFARFPVWRVAPLDGGGTAIDISDVRFIRDGDSPAEGNLQVSKRFAGRPSRRAGFTFEIILDAQGSIISHGFKE